MRDATLSAKFGLQQNGRPSLKGQQLLTPGWIGGDRRRIGELRLVSALINQVVERQNHFLLFLGQREHRRPVAIPGQAANEANRRIPLHLGLTNQLWLELPGDQGVSNLANAARRAKMVTTGEHYDT
jgi:hypothetical protein